MIDELTHENAVNDVRNGMSYLQAAKKHGVDDFTVGCWCRDVGVQSIQAGKWKTDEVILDVVMLHNAVTCYALAETLGCTGSALNKRLQRMIQGEKIQSFRIPPRSHAAHSRGLFTKFINTRIYYVSKDDLAEWVRSQLPEEVSLPLRRCVTHIFRSVGKIFKED